jgi:hypothetical protein
MIPKQKAEELVDKYRIFLQNTDTEVGEEILCTLVSKSCALIAVDEMIVQNGELYINQLGEKALQFYIKNNNFLFEVKKEIEKL